MPNNKRVALFTDTAEDGAAMGALWESQAPKYGYTIAYQAQFPVGTTDFSQFIQKAKDADADVMIAQVDPAGRRRALETDEVPELLAR